MGELYVYILAQYANCQSNHQANYASCLLWQKAQIQARKSKIAKKAEVTIKATITLGPSKENEKIFAPSDQKREIEVEEW